MNTVANSQVSPPWQFSILSMEASRLGPLSEETGKPARELSSSLGL